MVCHAKYAAKVAVAKMNGKADMDTDLANLIEQLTENMAQLTSRFKALQFSDRLYIAGDLAEADPLAHIRAQL